MSYVINNLDQIIVQESYYFFSFAYLLILFYFEPASLLSRNYCCRFLDKQRLKRIFLAPISPYGI